MIIVTACIALASCATHKTVTTDTIASVDKTQTTTAVTETKTQSVTVTNADSKQQSQTSVASADKKKIDYVRKIYDNAVYTTDIVSKIDFTIDAMGKNVSVGGKIYMRKDQCIRIVLQAPFIGIEIGRLEFTPDYVLLVDRIHSQYVKATYNDLDFLKNNGLDFYTLQALYWNQLFLPGQQKLTDVLLTNYQVDMNATTNRKITMKSGKLAFTWTTDPSTAHITAATVAYATGTKQASTASWTYKSFFPLGSKQFPTDQTLTFSSKNLNSGQKMTVNIKMNKLTTDKDWEAQTKVSSSYKQVSAEEVLKQIVNM